MDDDDEILCPYGTQLDPLVEEETPSKKPIATEDQIVTDENGRRRFHGAFTGGFSAGYWNTVGSLEGWKPKSFRSTKLEKNETHKQQAIDFMDEEDLSEFGIAPQRVQPTSDFKQDGSEEKKENRKRKLEKESFGPIPGTPVLNLFLRAPKERVAVRLLKRMGWKPGQGIGARQTRKEKNTSNERNAKEAYLMQKYGCDVESANQEYKDNLSKDEDLPVELELSDDDEITFAPDDFEPFVCAIKDNTFGMGYSGLDRFSVLSSGSGAGSGSGQHVNLFGPLEIIGKNNKKLSISGQAFGVGALEEDDEDIYQRDDMTKYDFTLNDKGKKKKKLKVSNVQDMMVIDGFHEATDKAFKEKKEFIVNLPVNYVPKNWAVRISRFEPMDEDRLNVAKKIDEYKARGLGRHDLNPDQRGVCLGEPEKKSLPEPVKIKYTEKPKSKENVKNVLDLITSRMNSFTKGETINDKQEDIVELDDNVKKENSKILNEAKKLTEGLDKSVGVFKPFATNESKQERYEKFIEVNPRTEEEMQNFFDKNQPIHMSDWDREMEKKEFIQAKSIYKPLDGLMSDRFISEATVEFKKEAEKPLKDSNNQIIAVRTKTVWKPASLLCKRFNIVEPFCGAIEETKIEKATKFTLFDYLEHSVNRKDNFITPVIIPKHVQKNKKMDNEVESAASISQAKVTPQNTTLSVKSPDLESNNGSKDLNFRISSKSFPAPKPKTELEIRIEESKGQHPSEKRDLYKSIFDSSSEDEDDGEENTEKTPEIPTNNQLFEVLPKSLSEINVHRNTDQPTGIFAALFNKTEEIPPVEPANVKINSQENLPKITFKSKKERENPDNQEEEMYGPKLPDKIEKCVGSTKEIVESSPKLDDEISAKLVKLIKKHKSKSIEKWVEKKVKKKKSKDKEKHRKKDKKDNKDKHSLSKIKKKKSKKHKKKNK